MEATLPDGVVTFLFTDIEGSTNLWEQAPDEMGDALRQHDEIVDAALEANHGISVKPRGEGDSRFVVFPDAADAAAGIADIQRALADFDWRLPRPIKVRASLHTGSADLHLGDYYGPAVNRAARIRAIAHGGQTIVSGSTYELIQDRLPQGVTARDMGEHSLKDLTRPERIFQLDIEGLANDFPPLRSLETVSNNLPRQLTEFIGREKEVAETKRLLGETRLLTILAPGGTGKTRLAIQAGADLASNYQDGVYFVNLADISGGDEILQVIAESIGLVFSADEEDEVQLHRFLSNRTMLLIIDNVEHVLDGAPLIGSILQAAPDVTVLATSRAKLNLAGETAFVLGGLDLTWETPEEALGCSGVRLFIDAAKHANPAFTLNGDDLAPLARILSITGGSPLGIVLAAAWVDMLSMSEIADEVTKSLDFLETEMGGVPDRHRSVRAVFDYSWDLLSEEERTVFSALSVFRGGFTRDAATEVSGASIRHLATLASKSLLAANPETGRYTIHEMLRQYAEAALTENRARLDEVADAHAGFYAALADNAYDLFPVSDHLEMLRIFEDDLDNIKVAWRHLVSVKNVGGLRRIIPILHAFYEMRSRYLVGSSLLQEAIDGVSDVDDDDDEKVVVALAVSLQGWYRALLGQPNASGLDQGLGVLRRASDASALWLGLQGAALVYSYLGRIDEMVQVTEEAMETGIGLGGEFWAAGSKNWRALAAIQSGDILQAKGLLDEALAVLERCNDHYFITWTLLLQATIAMAEERPHDAIAIHSRQADVCSEIRYARGTMLALEGLGKANLAIGDLEASKEAFVGSLAVAERTSMIIDLLGLMAKVGQVLGLMGDSEGAVELLSTVIAQPESQGHTMTDPLTPVELANGPFEVLRTELDPNVFSSAEKRGLSRSYEIALKDLLAGTI